MTESKEAANKDTSFDQHPLYRAAIQQLAEGQETEAAAKLRQLSELYPQEQTIRDLLVRTELRASFAMPEQVPSVHSQPTPILRRVVLFLLAITAGLIVIAGFVAVYDQLVAPAVENKQQEIFIESLRQDGQKKIQTGDWSGARKTFEELMSLKPNDPEALASLEFISLQESLDQLYVEAITVLAGDDWQTALALLRQLEAQSPGYRDAQQRIQELQQQEILETTWQEAQTLFQARDWPGAISILRQIQSQNLDFRRSQVEELLHKSYVELAREQIDQANSDLQSLREAVGYLEQALRLRPADQELLAERYLAREFLDGAEAFANGDQVGTAAHWHIVYTTRRDYQGGALETHLREVYPQAARQLIARANGDANQLRLAIVYLDQALVFEPGDQALIEERRLAAEYVTGNEAFFLGSWDEAIAHWAVIYAIRQDYQNGILADNLRLACDKSRTPNETLCPP